MSEESNTGAYIRLHISVFLWGFTAVLGALISVKEVPLVWYRLVITSASLLLVPGAIAAFRSVSLRDFLRIAGAGCIVAAHWVCFYGSIKYANASIALSCLATTSFMAALIEPLIVGRRIHIYELGLGLLVIPGVLLITYFSPSYHTAIVLGLVAALLAAIFTVLNKALVARHAPLKITFIELVAGLIFLTLLLPGYIAWFGYDTTRLIPDANDVIYLAILSIACTLLPFMLSLRALQKLSAFANTLTLNLEPVYGMILAAIFLEEHKELNLYFYIGTAIILSSVFLHPYIQRLENERAGRNAKRVVEN